MRRRRSLRSADSGSRNEREQAITDIDKAGLLQLDAARRGRLLGRIRALGMAEVEKGLKA